MSVFFGLSSEIKAFFGGGFWAKALKYLGVCVPRPNVPTAVKKGGFTEKLYDVRKYLKDKKK